MSRHITFITFVLLTLMCSCVGINNNSSNIRKVALTQQQQNEIKDTKFVKYAEGFSVKEFGEVKLIDITDPAAESSAIFRYALVPKASKGEIIIPEEYQPIEVPLSRVICMTTLQLSPFIKLNESDKIVGVTSTRFLHNKELNDRFKDGSLSRIGIEGEFDTDTSHN
ncbi:MAG: iron ABC transporter substrate-binding protein, partial [Rikenellaceae bacterium]